MVVHFKKQSLKVISIKQRARYLKLLFKWNGGIWDLLWIDFIWFLGMHILITILYHFVLFRFDTHRIQFESFIKYVENLRNLVPLSFLLGFFVSAVLARWWNVVMNIPWTSHASIFCQSYVIGKVNTKELPNKIYTSEVEKEKDLYKIRMSILRYLNMAWIFAFVNFSYTIRKRFFIKDISKSQITKVTNQLLRRKGNCRIPVREKLEAINSDSVIKSYYNKFILEEEIQFLEKQEQLLPANEALMLNYWTPIQWALAVIKKAYKLGYISESRFYESMIGMVNEFRGQIGTIYVYNDWKMPLVYIQVVIFVVYSFLFTEIFNQVIITKNDPTYQKFNFQTYFPIMTILKYFLYMGWFQIGLCLMYPFEGNNADMPLNDVLNFNLMVSTIGCNTNPDMFPVFLRNEFGNEEDQIKKLSEFTKFFENDIIESVNVDKLIEKSEESRINLEFTE